MKEILRTFCIASFLFLIHTVNAQIDTIYLTKNKMNGYSQLKLTTDSIHSEGSHTIRYYSIPAKKIVPQVDGLDSIILAFQYWLDGSIKVGQLGIENSSFEDFGSSKSYDLSLTKDKKTQFQVEVSLQFLNDALYVACYHSLVGEMTFQDTSILCHIRPFISNRNPIQFSEIGKRTYNSNASYRFGENFQIRNQNYQLDGLDLSNNTILLQQVPDSIGQYGYKEGTKIRDFTTLQTQMYSSESTHIYLGSKEYSMIYFWGEWCSPCIRKIPKNQELYNKLDTTRIEVTNIALCTDLQSKNETFEIIEQKKIPGNHVFEMMTNNPISNLLNIISYPTRLLIDSEGNILYRSDGGKDEGLQETLVELNMILEE